MKLRYFFIFCLLFAVGLISWSNDYILVPENFFMHKGDSLNVHLFSSELFESPKEVKYEQATTEKFALYDGGKKIDLKATAKANALPALSYKMDNSGLAMVEMVRNYPADDVDRGDFTAELESEGLVKLSEKVNNIGQNRIRTKYTCYLKSLVMVDKPGGSIYSTDLDHNLEIILKSNPYKLSYGDDLTAMVKFRKKPLVNAHVDLLIKTASGRVYPQKLVSDANGLVSFSVNREGIYLLRTVNIEASTSKTYDYEKWGADYSFAFSNNSIMPNTYKEFGLGNLH
ncbi:DUF4198 domain-containing protein [Mucilaginibacter sp. HMF5004]|uniref:DUF4198 domain-containing protein n=1 Tax=Mucilaginibacter rivuli TaxID=2857527 RepID=UPI001C6043E0|nr:DUF4198 domain-containing protein [Mucilaginibacter rivuli]MBW4891093.1 DUF4198 domain-containing protein [Mucilaginibacter rivuli]